MEIYNIAGLAIIVPFFLLYLLYRTDPRYLVGVALVLLISAALEDAFGNGNAANDIAIVSYYCLVAGVALMILDGYLEKHRNGRVARKIGASYTRAKEWLLGKKNLMEYAFFLLPIAVFTILALVILEPLLGPGYVLITDMVFGPIVPTAGLYGLSQSLGGGNALTALEAVMTVIMPGWVMQKIFLFLIFFLSGYTMYLFARRTPGPARYYASFLYMVNPFIYARMLAGAWALMFAYALTPLAFLSFINMIGERRARGRALRSPFIAASLFSLVAVFDIHTFAILVFLCVLYYIASLAFSWKSAFSFLRRTALPALLFVGMFLLFNAYWLIISPSSSGSILGSFTFLDAIAFASQPTIFHNTLFSIAAMYGFFRSGLIYPTAFYPDLVVFFLLFLFLAVFGLVSSWSDRSKGPLSLTLAVGMVVAVLLATGISSPLTTGIYTYLYNNLPFFNGFREPQKLVAIVALGYSYLGALGLYEFQNYLRGDGGRRPVALRKRAVQVAITVLIIVSLIAPFAYSYMEINGFNGQLTDVQYPASWYNAEGIIAQNTSDNSVLVFPWHTYMYYNWSQTKFASPFNQFFKQNLIYGGVNSYVGGEQSVRSGTDALITQLIAQKANVTNLGNIMSLLDAKYLFFSKSGDYQNYTFLYRQSDLTLLLNTSECALFVNDHPVARSYIVQQVRGVDSYSQLINLSSSVDLMDYAWVVGGSHGAARNSSFVALPISAASPVSYRIEMPGLIDVNSSSYLVFTPPAGELARWQASGNLITYYQTQINGTASSPLQLYSIYTVTGGPGSVTFTYNALRSLQYSYALSGVSFAIATAIVLISCFPVQSRRIRKRLSAIFGK